MTIHNNVYTLGTAGVLICPNDNMAQEVHVKNMTKSSNEYVWIGGAANVGTANGLEIEPQEAISLVIRPGDKLYAMSTPSGLKAGVLRITKGD